MFSATILKKPSDPSPSTRADALGLNVAELVGVIVECGANLADARVQPVRKMYKELATHACSFKARELKEDSAESGIIIYFVNRATGSASYIWSDGAGWRASVHVPPLNLLRRPRHGRTPSAPTE